MAQKVWIDGELVDNPFELSGDDLRTLQIWKRKQGDCPYCLIRLPFDRFATYVRGTKTHSKKLSEKMAKCPACHQGFRLSTLIKITDMSVEDFSWWFWENVFLYRMMERVDGDNFFARIKLWRYEDRQIFWDVWREFKSTGDRTGVAKDRDNYEAYMALQEGRVCASCDTLLTETDLEQGECPQCGDPIPERGGD